MVQIFNEIHFRNVKGDIFGGVTAAVIALPMALAFGVASGAGAAAGLYGAIMVGLFAALFGGSPALISEPTGPMTVVFTAVITKLVASDPVNGLAMAFTVVIMTGVFQIIFGFARLGKYITMMPYTVISGFMSGIGIILIILQLAPIMGHAAPAGGVLGILRDVPVLISAIQPNETMLALLAMGILFFMPSGFKKYMPPQLLALIVGTLVSVMFLEMDAVRRIGEIPKGLPEIQIPIFSIEQWQVMFVDAVVLGMLGCIDALLTSVIADSLTRQEHNSNKELVGQGIANIMSGLFGGLPGAGATMGTVVNIQAGAVTALSGLVRAGVLLVVVLWAAKLTEIIPLAVLAGIAFKVGVDIIDWGFLKRAHIFSGRGALITYAVILLTVFVDLIVAVGIGLFVANIMTITRLSEFQEDDVNVVSDPDESDFELSPYEKDLLQSAEGRVVLLHLRGSMMFGISRTISRANTHIQDRDALIVDLSEVKYMGVSSSLAVEETIFEALNADKRVYLVAMEAQPMKRLEKMGVLERLTPDRIVNNLQKALEGALYGNEPAPSTNDEVKA